MFPINLGMCSEEVLLTLMSGTGKHVGSITHICGRDSCLEIHEHSLLYRAQYSFLLSLALPFRPPQLPFSPFTLKVGETLQNVVFVIS